MGRVDLVYREITGQRVGPAQPTLKSCRVGWPMHAK